MKVTHPELTRVFETEQEFLNAPDHIKKQKGQGHGAKGDGNRGFVVTHKKSNKVYWVWAASKNDAIGFVARRMELLSAVSYNEATVITKMPEDNLLAMIASLSPEMQEKVRRRLGGFICPQCKQKCESKAGLTLHLRRCAATPSQES